MPLPGHNGTILCKVSTGVNCPYVPEKLRRQVFDALHCISHPGAHATQKLIATQFVWPNMNKDIRAWARSCLHCQRSKVSRHNRSPIGTFRMPDARFSHLHLDLVRPLPILRGTYCLHALIISTVGWKQFRSLMPKLKRWSMHLSTNGSPGLALENCSHIFVRCDCVRKPL